MQRQILGQRYVPLLFSIAVISTAAGLKLLFSLADPQALRWLLGPTAWLVACFADMEFVFEHGTGYIDLSHGIAIAPACSGFNFLIICLCSGALQSVWRLETVSARIFWIGRIAVSVYGITILVNTLRIVVAMELYQLDIYQGPITPVRVHRILGITIYFTVLCLYNSWLSFTLEMVQYNKIRCNQGLTTGRPGLWPLCCYLTIALGVPLVTGGLTHPTGELIEHGVTVTGISLLIYLLLFSRQKSTKRRSHNRDNWPRLYRIVKKQRHSA